MQSGLTAYLNSVKSRDPAARSRWDVLFYPGVWALGLHRIAHWLWEGKSHLRRAPGQPFRAVPDGDRHPPWREDRQALLPRSWLQRDRRERRDRRRRHHLPARDAGRHQSDHRRRRQAPPDDSRRRRDWLRSASAWADRGGRGREDRRQFGRDQGRCAWLRPWSAFRPSRCPSTPFITAPASCHTARRAARTCDPVRIRLAELESEIEELRTEVAVLRTARQPQPKVKSA